VCSSDLVSRAFDVAAGGAIGLVTTAVFLLAFVGQWIAVRLRRTRRSAAPAVTG
jgi:hypothetical protein